MNLNINTEAEFDACVKSIGGVKVSDLFQGSPSFSNADYLFRDYNIVAELKCLSKDMARDMALQKKFELIIRRHWAESKMIVFGTCPMTTDQLSPNCTKEIAELYRKPIRDVMQKANKQIRETKSELNIESAHGLLILVNDNNTAIDPRRIDWILGETFKRDRLSSIDSVLFLTLNLTATHPKFNTNFLVWFEMCRDQGVTCQHGFYESLRNAVYGRWRNILGQNIGMVKFINENDVYEMKYNDGDSGKILIKIDR